MDRLELLEAFACSKAREFESFKEGWVATHPEPVVADLLMATEPVEVPKSSRRKKPVVEEE